MLSINIHEVSNKSQIAEVIKNKMIHNGITKKEIIEGTHLSKTAVNSVLNTHKNDKDFMFGTLIKILSFLKIKVFIGNSDETNSKVLSLF
jgi:predicted XRE-type DNA-binding protein